MGNQATCKDCAPADETLYKKQYGVVNYSRQAKEELLKNSYYFDSPAKQPEDLRVLKDHWERLQNIQAKIVRPCKIESLKEQSLFGSKDVLRVWLPVQEYTLGEYAAQNLKLNPLIPEIQLLNILSSATDALLVLARLGIPHGNVSPDTILFDNKGDWLLSTPNKSNVSLESRMTTGKEPLMFLVAPERARNKGEPLGPKADLFSLAVSLAHTVDPFPPAKMAGPLTQQDLSAKLVFIEQYYSRKFLEIVSSILVLDEGRRISLAELRRILNGMIDLTGDFVL